MASLDVGIADFEEDWPSIKSTLGAIFERKNVTNEIWESTFKSIFKLIYQKEPLGPPLYENTEQFLKDQVLKINQEIKDSDDLLYSYATNWPNYSKSLSLANVLYRSFNEQYLTPLRHCNIQPEIAYVEKTYDMLKVEPLGRELWKSDVIEPNYQLLAPLFVRDVQRLRDGMPINEENLKEALASLVEVGVRNKLEPLKVYEDTFEILYLENFDALYKDRSGILKKEVTSAAQFVKLELDLYEAEKSICDKYLDSSTWEKVEKIFLTRMIVDHIDYLNENAKIMIEEENTEDLPNMYKILCLVENGLKESVDAFHNHIKAKTAGAIPSIPALKSIVAIEEFFEKFLEYRETYHLFIEKNFQSDVLFFRALDGVCSAIINQIPEEEKTCKTPEMLVKYCDNLLKKKLPDDVLEKKLTDFELVFKYADNKDVFESVFARTQARRLIRGQSQSIDGEEMLINKLREYCDCSFIKNTNQIIIDIKYGPEITAKFTQYLKDQDENLKLSFAIQVLNSQSWPLSQANLQGFTIPQEMEKAIIEFKKFYNGEFKGRVLKWLHNQGIVELGLKYLKKPYIAIITPYQMATMLALQEMNSLTFNDIFEAAGMEKDLLKAQIQSLIEFNIFLKPDTEDISDDTVIALNMNYGNKKIKFKIPPATNKESNKEKDKEMEEVAIQVNFKRYNILQAIIVKLMKANKTLTHNDLVDMVIKDVKNFNPDIGMIGKAIIELTNNKYLQKKEDAPNTYEYLA